MMAKPLNAMRICVCRKPVDANTLSEEPTLKLLALRQQRDEISGAHLDRNNTRPLVRQRLNQCCQSQGSRFPRHSRKARGFLPGIDIEPRKRGKDAEPCSISILANRRAEEFVELRPDERRQGGMGHVNTRFPS